MSMQPNHTPTLDEEITAYLDGELDGAAAAALETRLAADAAARTRLDELRAGRPRAEPFDLILDMAPIGRLEAMLEAAAAPAANTWSSFGGLRALAAAVLLLILGGAIGFGLSRGL